RREGCERLPGSRVMMILPTQLSGTMHGRTDALVGTAATDVADHRRIDFSVGRLRRHLEQGQRRHDLSGLAVTALHDIVFDPGALQRMRAVAAETLDRADLLADQGRCRDHAGTHRRAIDMHRAGTTLGDAATEL